MKILENDTIYTFKLTTGEEIVARLVAQNPSDNYAIIAHPIMIVPGPQGLQMVPGLFSADLTQDVRLNNNNWVMVAQARGDVRDSWIEATTGIKPVTKKILTG